jgi:Rps23 Pro-64 3,4-dihydroxylase Tpa1-like proline 4-hydroxylase
MLNPSTLARLDEHAVAFAHAKPFRHVVIDDFLDADAAESLLREFPPFERGNARTENGDLGNKSTIEKIRDLGASFAALDDTVQSAAFLDAIGAITGIPKLLYDPWYFGGGTHENRDTQDLDAHVDFNRHPVERWHRRLNLIVYLNHEWDDRWGGSLRLHSNPRSDDDAIVTVTPLFNRAVVFETTETSWHSFPEIRLPADKRDLTRKSIALYFYSEDRPVAETGPTHSTIYVDRPLPSEIAVGRTLDASDLSTLRILIARRDQHVARLYGDITSLTDQLGRAQAQLSVATSLPAPIADHDGAPPAPLPQVPTTPLRAIARRLPPGVKRALRRLWHGAA